MPAHKVARVNIFSSLAALSRKFSLLRSHTKDLVLRRREAASENAEVKAFEDPSEVRFLAARPAIGAIEDLGRCVSGFDAQKSRKAKGIFRQTKRTISQHRS